MLIKSASLKYYIFLQSQNNITLNKIVNNLSNTNSKLRFSQMSPKCPFYLVCPVHNYTSYLIVISLMSFNLSSIFFMTVTHWRDQTNCPYKMPLLWMCLVIFLCHLACSSDFCISCKPWVDLQLDRLGKHFQFECIMYDISYFVLLYIRRPKISRSSNH